MPTPILHAGFALAAAEACGERRWRRLGWAVFLAVWPDLDLVPGLLVGDPHLFHHGASHSLLLQAAAALAVSRLAGLDPRLALAAGLSHCGLDLFNHDPLGTSPSQALSLPLFWPLSDLRSSPLAPLFTGGRLTTDLRDWLAPDNLRCFAAEGAVAGALLAGATALRRLRTRAALEVVKSGALINDIP